MKYIAVQIQENIDGAKWTKSALLTILKDGILVPLDLNVDDEFAGFDTKEEVKASIHATIEYHRGKEPEIRPPGFAVIDIE